MALLLGKSTPTPPPAAGCLLFAYPSLLTHPHLFSVPGLWGLTTVCENISDPSYAGVTPRQKTFSAAKQGKASPRTRTKSYRHENVVYDMSMREGPYNAEVERLQALEDAVQPMAAVIAGRV